jgi:hypothetical protein
MHNEVNLRAISQNRFKVAKQLWGVSFAVQISLFLLGAISIFIANTSPYVPIVLFLLTILSELIQWRSDIAKGQAESILRKLDMRDSFQKEISEADRREILSLIPQNILNSLTKEPATAYFASNHPDTPRKAIENLVESIWYTRHLSDSMVKICVVSISTLIIFSVTALMITVQSITKGGTQTDIIKVITSWLLLTFSLGIFRNAWGYHKLHQYCLKAEAIGEYLLSTQVISEADASKQWLEYQLSRSTAPLLPDWLWSIRKSSLDYAWESGSAKQEAKAT